jgi:hypothetical protein
VSEFISKRQFFIQSKDAKAIGKLGLYKNIEKLMVEFFNEICKAALNGDEDIFCIQYAISKLDEKEKEVVIKGTEVAY